MKCKYCNESLDRLMCFAMLKDAGCHVSPDPLFCCNSPSGEHDLSDKKPEDAPASMPSATGRGAR